MIGRIVLVTSSEDVTCAAARAYVGRHTRTLPSSGRFFIGRFQCDAIREGSQRYRASCVYTASVFRVEYYALGSCGDITVDLGGPTGESGYIDIRARGLSCAQARQVVRRTGEAGSECPNGWRCRRHLETGRTVWTRGGRRITFNPAG